MSTQARASFICTPQWLCSARESGLPVCVLEVVFEPVVGTSSNMIADHIPGAFRLNTEDLENGFPRWHLKSPEELHDVIVRLGIGLNHIVVVYSSQTIAAARAWWVLLYAGVRDVCLLDGGVATWRRAGFPVDSKMAAPTPVLFSKPIRSWLLASTALIRSTLIATTVFDTWLVDVRSIDEYIGHVTGYSYMAHKGRIPGSVYGGDADDKAMLYQNADGTLKTIDEVRRLWIELGVLDSNSCLATARIIFYCGTGWRSSLASLFSMEMGIQSTMNYSDGWSAWSTVYERDPSGHQGITLGWRQQRSSNPII